MTTIVELSMEDDKCVARNVVNAVPADKVFVANPDNSIASVWGEMKEKEKLEFARKFLDVESAYGGYPELDRALMAEYNQLVAQKRLMAEYPKAEAVDVCGNLRCLETLVDTPCRFAQHDVVRLRFPGADGTGTIDYCRRCGRVRDRSVIAENSPRHVHARILTPTGKKDTLLHLYGLSGYIKAKKGAVPTELMSVVKASPATTHEIASPEVLGSQVVRMRDPLLLAVVSDRRFIIWQWE